MPMKSSTAANRRSLRTTSQAISMPSTPATGAATSAMSAVSDIACDPSPVRT